MGGHLQQMLEYHEVGSGFDAGSYCEVTERAVSALQERHGLPVTGRCDEGTWAALAVGPGAGSADEDAPPADIALSTQVGVVASDEAHTLDQLTFAGVRRSSSAHWGSRCSARSR